MKLSRADRKRFAPVVDFPDRPTVGQIKLGIERYPVVFVTYQPLIRFRSNPNMNMVSPPCYTIHRKNGNNLMTVEHTINLEELERKLQAITAECVRKHGKKPFIIQTTVEA